MVTSKWRSIAIHKTGVCGNWQRYLKRSFHGYSTMNHLYAYVSIRDIVATAPCTSWTPPSVSDIRALPRKPASIFGGVILAMV